MCSFRLAGAVGGGRPEERRTPSRDRRSHARAPARRPRAPTRRTSHVLRRRYQPDELPPRTRRADVPARQRALPQTALLQEALLVQDRERVEREQHGLAKRPQGHRASGGRGRGAGSGSGCLRGVRCGANGWSFFRLIDDARVFARCQLPQPGGRIALLSTESTFETLFVGFREPDVSRSPRRSIGVKSVRRK